MQLQDVNFLHNFECLLKFPKIDNTQIDVDKTGKLYINGYFSKHWSMPLGKTIEIINNTCIVALYESAHLLDDADLAKDDFNKVVKADDFFNKTKILLEKVRDISEVYSKQLTGNSEIELLKEVVMELERGLDALQSNALDIKEILASFRKEHFLDSKIEEFSFMEMDLTLGSGSTLELRDQNLQRISPDDLLPGDILCTYESISTQPTIMYATMAQNLTKAGKNMHKMLHFEVVLEVHPNGIVKIAHANGLNKLISSELQDTSKYTPGTAIVAFRPKNEKLREEIVKVASTTVNKGNSWKIKGLTDKESIVGKIYGMYQTDRQGKNKSEERKLKKMARFAVDSTDKFCKKDRDSLKAMSCAQFATNVINSSLIRLDPKLQEILSNDSLTRDEKIQLIYKQMLGEDFKNVVAPCGLYHAGVNSTLLTTHILNSHTHWEVPGYIGIIDEGETELNKILENARPLLNSELSQLGFDLSKTYAIFKALGIHKFYGNQEAREIKLIIAFTYLYAEENQLDPKNLIYSIFKADEVSAIKPKQDLKCFLEKVESFREIEITPHDIGKDIAIKHTTIPLSHLAPLGIRVIKSLGCSYPEILKAELLSLFSVEQMKGTANSVSLAVKGTTIGLSSFVAGLLTVLGSSAFPPLLTLLAGGGILAATYKLHGNVNNSMIEWGNRIEKTFQGGRPTHTLKLIADVGFGNRPWIVYSGDAGKTFSVEKVHQVSGKNDEWMVTLRVESDLQYKFFIGKEEIDLNKPYNDAKWQVTAGGGNVMVPTSDLVLGEKDENQRRKLPDCIYPNWK